MMHPYEDRYRRVYSAGARFWETPIPTEELADFVRERDVSKGSRVIEFGCGEGRDSIFLAKLGFKVTAVDVAPSAINRAREWAQEEGVNVDFQVNDATALKGIPDKVFELGVNVGCLLMFPEHGDRRKHFSEAFRVLKPAALYFLCNMAVLTREEVEREFGEKYSWPRVGDLTPRKIIVDGEEKEILLPIIAGHGFTKEELFKELSEAGFRIIEAQRKKTRLHGICWIIIAQKP
jgi:ubiquinone/menaquinone biosynthesis C-methylase UbiE